MTDDAISVLMREEGLDFPAAVSELARRRSAARGDPVGLQKVSDYTEAVIHLFRERGELMSEMVERVARAICAVYGDDFNEQPTDLATLREQRKREGAVDEHGMGIVRAYDCGLPTQADWLDMARAAIAVMAEPTEAMILSGGAQLLTNGEYEPTAADGACEIWRVMIDAALK